MTSYAVFLHHEAESSTIGRYRHPLQSYGRITRKSPSGEKTQGKLSGGNKNQPSKFERYNFHRSFTIYVGSSSPVNSEIEGKKGKKVVDIPYVSSTSLQIDCMWMHICALHFYSFFCYLHVVSFPCNRHIYDPTFDTKRENHDWNFFLEQRK